MCVLTQLRKIYVTNSNETSQPQTVVVVQENTNNNNQNNNQHHMVVGGGNPNEFDFLNECANSINMEKNIINLNLNNFNTNRQNQSSIHITVTHFNNEWESFPHYK